MLDTTGNIFPLVIRQLEKYSGHTDCSNDLDYPEHHAQVLKYNVRQDCPLHHRVPSTLTDFSQLHFVGGTVGNRFLSKSRKVLSFGQRSSISSSDSQANNTLPKPELYKERRFPSQLRTTIA